MGNNLGYLIFIHLFFLSFVYKWSLYSLVFIYLKGSSFHVNIILAVCSEKKKTIMEDELR